MTSHRPEPEPHIVNQSGPPGAPHCVLQFFRTLSSVYTLARTLSFGICQLFLGGLPISSPFCPGGASSQDP